MEIEVKITYENKEKIVTWLKDNDFIFSKIKEIRDSYFGKDEDTMSTIKSLYRLRNVVGGFQELTLKDGLEDMNGVWTRREINVGITDPEAMRIILESLGCKLIKENFSKREIWIRDNIEFAFIDFTKPAELHIAEIEGLDNASVQKCIDDLGKLVSVAGDNVFAVFDKKLIADEN
jgi:predicted adenylyl cyclase CyaB